MAAQDLSFQNLRQEKKPNYLGGVQLPNFKERVPEVSMQENLRILREKIEIHNNLQNDLLAVELKIAELNANGSAERAISPGAEDGTTRRLLRAISAHHEEIDKIGNEMETARGEILKAFPDLVNGIKDRRTIDEAIKSVKNVSLRQKLEDMVHDVKHETNREFWNTRLGQRNLTNEEPVTTKSAEVVITPPPSAPPVEDSTVSISSVMESGESNQADQMVESLQSKPVEQLDNPPLNNTAMVDSGRRVENFDFTPAKEIENAAAQPVSAPPVEQVRADQTQVDQTEAKQALPNLADSSVDKQSEPPVAEEPIQEPVETSIDSDKKIFEMFDRPDDNLVSSEFQVLPGGKLPPADDESLKKAA